jgi:hypothetical protein
MATTHNIIEVGYPAAAIVPATGGFGHDVTIQNNGSLNVFIGGEGVSDTSYGFKLAPGAAISFELDGQDAIFGYAADGTTVSVLSINLEKSK